MHVTMPMFREQLAERKVADVGLAIEHVMMAQYANILAEGDVAVDVGAHLGLHTRPMSAHVGKTGRVYAFEPIYEKYMSVAYSSRRSEFENIHAYHMGVSDRREKQTLHINHVDPGRSSVVNIPEDNFSTVEIELVSLDDFLDVPAVRFIKMDVEGYELKVFFGARKLIARTRPIIVFESSLRVDFERLGYQLEDFTAFVDENDYSVYDLFGQPVADLDRKGMGWYFYLIPGGDKAAVEHLRAGYRAYLDSHS